MAFLGGTQQNPLQVCSVNRLGKEFVGPPLDRFHPDPQSLVIKFGKKDDLRLGCLSFDLGKKLKCFVERLLETNDNGINVLIVHCRQHHARRGARDNQ
jgi:hypothetical protein